VAAATTARIISSLLRNLCGDMKKKNENAFDMMVKNLMLPTDQGGGGHNKKEALDIADRALKKIQPKK